MNHSQWEVVIGLEIHAQINTQTKMFSPDSAEFSSRENSSIHPISLGFPGMLPSFNKKIIKKALLVGKAFNCDLNKESIFERKNYFYPDLPKGYQISQFKMPLLEKGYVEFYSQGEQKKIHLERIHIEEDAGKLSHQDGYSLVDFNRAGIPLLEIVSCPEIKSAEEAANYARMVRLVLIYLGVSDGHLQEGSIRFDCNISLKPCNESQLGTKVEIKNLNSFRFVEKALNYEIERQSHLLNKSKSILQETRLFNPKKGETFPMRSKEDASDYRYFPEPDLPPLIINHSLMEIKVELPFERIKKYEQDYKIPLNSATILVEDFYLCQFFEKCLKKSKHYLLLSKWLLNDVLGYLKENKLTSENISITSEQFVEFIDVIESKLLSSKMAKDLFPKIWKSKENIRELIKNLGVKKIDDTQNLNQFIDQVIEQFPEQCEKYRNGKENILKFLMGQIMKLSKGQADPEKTQKLLKEKIKN